MNYENILVEYENSVATIILNRPNVMNALNSQMRAELTDAVTRYSKEARVVVLTGSGNAFCSGQDLGDGNSLQSVDLERTLRDEYEPLIRAIVNSPVPTVTALNGAAAGAGANLALAADIVIAKSSAYFVQAFSRIGLIPDVGGTYFLPRAMGLAKAIGSSIFADKIMAAEAYEIGLIYEYVEDDNYDIHLKSRPFKKIIN
jgi:2-(1,2-epoxy-1,2-dihydrophenyl)acetyl-CoA isomerase